MKEEFKWNTMRLGNEKTMWPKGIGHRNAIRTAVHGVGNGAIYSRGLDCCERKWAANRAVTDHGDLTVKIRNRWTEKLLTKMPFHRRQGFLPDLVTRIWCPRRLRVPSLNKIAQTEVRPSPLWKFRAANCFRDFIVAWQNENLRWSGLSYLSRITGIRRGVANSFCVSAFCPLECKRIRSASLRWFSDEAKY